jgi:hypothetical protein
MVLVPVKYSFKPHTNIILKKGIFLPEIDNIPNFCLEFFHLFQLKQNQRRLSSTVIYLFVLFFVDFKQLLNKLILILNDIRESYLQIHSITPVTQMRRNPGIKQNITNQIKLRQPFS